MSARDSNDYKVGYGMPPKQTQFKPGQSGNPKGRPPKKLEGGLDVSKLLNPMVTIGINGKKRKVTEFEARYLNMAFAALNKGDVVKGIKFLKAAEKYLVFAPPTTTPADPGSVIKMPKGWDRGEFVYMYRTFGPPPWFGNGDMGLTAEDKERLGYGKAK